jgi:hypothetical protein
MSEKDMPEGRSSSRCDSPRSETFGATQPDSATTTTEEKLDAGDVAWPSGGRYQ